MASDDVPARLREIPSRLIGRCAMYSDRISRAQLAPLHQWHYAALVTLRDAGPASQAALSQRTGIHRSDLVAVLNELVEQGYVERAPDPADRRRNVVSLTPAGRTRLRTLDRRVDRAQEQLLAALTGKERAELVRLLTKLVDHHGGAH